MFYRTSPGPRVLFRWHLLRLLCTPSCRPSSPSQALDVLLLLRLIFLAECMFYWAVLLLPVGTRIIQNCLKSIWYPNDQNLKYYCCFQGQAAVRSVPELSHGVHRIAETGQPTRITEMPVWVFHSIGKFETPTRIRAFYQITEKGNILLVVEKQK